jgi:cellulose synthase (UDP-forming)
MFAVATVKLAPGDQAVFAGLSMVVFLIANRLPGRGVTHFLIALSLAVSLRYIVWRITETLRFATWPELALGSILVIAELYAIVVLVLGYAQTTWPLERKPLPLPDDPATWPTVDVYIPSYNEPLSLVRATVLGAMAMDWPRDKLRVHILDDGRRADFREFAAQVGCSYLIRADNAHAKAGNLNAAMKITDGEFIAVFDCDHIPTRGFLQFTLGWLVAHPNIAMVQTPHHFYSPDPFQRNLAAGTRVPAEGNLFYGLIQDGNDFWNAAFFCGSCAVIRRRALESIGGFAVETVTEDAHTMLKLHRRGWDSAYLRLPLAAGLATERLALHIGQRMRWARGMLQILRTDCPLFGPGLSFGQRLCYLQATGHFLFAIPRLVFLTAPLAFLLLGQNVIAASPLAITAYALPHMFHSIATNARLQRNWRHSFWSEIYETVLALFLVRVTVVTLLSPRRGKFNVTAKGGLLENGFFDLPAVYPNIILALLLLLGILRGAVGMALVDSSTLAFQAFALNCVWATLSLLIVLAALAVGRETRQVRVRARVAAALPVVLRLPDGRDVAATTRDLSEGGARLATSQPLDGVEGAPIRVRLTLGAETLDLPALIRRHDGTSLQVRWDPATLAEEAAVVRAVFSRADAWANWADYPVDRPLVSLWRVLVSIGGLFRPRAGVAPRRSRAAPDAARPRRGMATALTVAVLLLLGAAVAFGQTPPHGTAHGAGPAAGMTVRVGPPSAAAPLLPPLPPAAADAAPAAADDAAPPVASPASTRRLVYTLRQLGAAGPLALRGSSELQGVAFGVRSDEVVTGAELSLTGAMSPALIPESSNITVTLNEQFVGAIPAMRGQPNFKLTLPVNPVFFQDDNRLNFRFTGRYTRDCNDPLSGLLWATVYDTSTLTLSVERLPPRRDLARLPQPFFDGFQKEAVALPFILPAGASNETLTAAGIVASWFGTLAGYRGTQFSAQTEAPASGDAVLVATAGDGGTVPLPPLNGPTIALRPNPNDPLATLLVIAGRTAEETLAAARMLAVGSNALSADLAVVQAPSVPARRPYDAPNWIPTDRPVKLGELVDAQALQSSGYTGVLHVPFRLAPDLYTWRDRPFALNVRFRAPTAPIIDLAPSRLDVGLNGVYLDTLSLAGTETQHGWLARALARFGVGTDHRVRIPPYGVYGDNDLQFFFDARPLQRGNCVAIPQDLHMSVDPTSTLDLTRGHHFTVLPNLALFVNAGFPFTRLADLAETAVVLPERPDATEIAAYLDMLGRFGALTGYPALRVAVVRPDAAATMAERDLLLIGSLGHLQGAAGLLARTAVQPEGARLVLALSDPLDPVRRLFGDGTDAARAQAAATLAAAPAGMRGFLVGGESPLADHRTVVAILATAPEAVARVVASLRDPEQAPLIQGDLALLEVGRVTSYRVAPTYTVGHLPLWMWPGWKLRDQPLGAVLVMLAGVLMLGLAWHAAMRRRAAARLSQPAR